MVRELGRVEGLLETARVVDRGEEVVGDGSGLRVEMARRQAAGWVVCRGGPRADCQRKQRGNPRAEMAREQRGSPGQSCPDCRSSPGRRRPSAHAP